MYILSIDSSFEFMSEGQSLYVSLLMNDSCHMVYYFNCILLILFAGLPALKYDHHGTYCHFH